MKDFFVRVKQSRLYFCKNYENSTTMFTFGALSGAFLSSTAKHCLENRKNTELQITQPSPLL
jgi:hypothetical protein